MSVEINVDAAFKTALGTVELRVIVDSAGDARLEFSDYRFGLARIQGEQAGFAAGLAGGDGLRLNLAEALAEVGLAGVPDLGELALCALSAFVVKGDDEQSCFAVAGTVDFNLDLHNLPLIGETLPEGQFCIEDLTFTFASGTPPAAKQEPIREALTGRGVQLPEGYLPGKGLSVAGGLKLAGFKTPFAPDPTPPEAAEPEAVSQLAAAAPASAPPVGDHTKWIKVGRSFGPLTIKRVGARFEAGTIYAPMDLAVAAGPLRLELKGAGLGVSLNKSKQGLKAIEFHATLDGLGVAFDKPPIGISGALYRMPSEGLRFDGSIVIKASSFALSALGSYEKLPGQDPSFFVFGVLNQELGGPPIFRVTGLAAGFGINRKFLTGPVEEVRNHPLVAFATAESGATAAELLDRISPQITPYLPPAPGNLWFTIGIKGNSFGLIDTFLMLTLALGDDVSVSVLGLSKLVIPPKLPGTATAKPIPPIAKVELQIKAEILPSAGIISVEASIASGSFVFAPACRLTGGFAFIVWFKGEHGGDFALTLGGWHPRFSRPQHYPVVPRVALAWRVTSELSVSGELYFGLTPSCVMAGGLLKARFQRGHLSAWFDAWADFLIMWEPFHYSIGMSVRLGARYVVTIDWGIFGTSRTPVSISLSVQLEIWGPPFGGTARVEWFVISFTIGFGSRTPLPPPVQWSHIKEKFLPEPEAFHGLAVTDGLLGELEGKVKTPVLAAKGAAFEIRCPTPLTEAKFSGDVAASEDDADRLGVRPMATDWSSTLEVKIYKGSANVSDAFEASGIKHSVPAAVWGKPGGASSKKPTAELVADALTGLRLAVRPPERLGEETSLPIADYREQTIPRDINWADALEHAERLKGVGVRPGDADLDPLRPTNAGFGDLIVAAATEVYPDLADGIPGRAEMGLLADVARHAFQAMPLPERTGAPPEWRRPSGVIA